MSTNKRNTGPIDGWDGLAEAMAKKCTVQYGQCESCLNKIGTHKCKAFGDRPIHYASALTKLKCPERKEQ